MSNKFLITDDLLGLFHAYWNELVRSNHTAKFSTFLSITFRMMDPVSGIFRSFRDSMVML